MGPPKTKANLTHEGVLRRFRPPQGSFFWCKGTVNKKRKKEEGKMQMNELKFVDNI
jgi:hypothetical protein